VTLAEIRQQLRGELETQADELLTVWFPRCIDREYGGFLCDFDHRWRPSGGQPKMLEYQARQTKVAARGALFRPDSATLRAAASHGFRYLRDRMWDSRHGGWYRMLDRKGAPLEGRTKHGHGSSYAIAACVACHALTGETECLELAQQGFAWLEKHAHDDRNGGYFVFYHEDGTPILSREKSPTPDREYDAIGTPFGFKDLNTTSDLLDCFSDLYRIWPDALVRERLQETLAIASARFYVRPGLMHQYMHPDWAPLPEIARYGQILHSVDHLLAASDALGEGPEAKTRQVARSIVDTMLRFAWDERKGGFSFAGPSFGPAHLEDIILYFRGKYWWVQTAGLKALLSVARLFPDGPYGEYFVRQWNYVKDYVIDSRHGGWMRAGLDTNPDARKQPKASQWKDASHEVEALLDSLEVLDAS
jgi:mannobiose 2-epimerase